MEEDFLKYEKEEYQICIKLKQLYNIKNTIINPTINPLERIDMFGQINSTDYAIEIKVREKVYDGYIIEKSKMIELIKEYKKGKQVRYINYIEPTDELIIFNLNTRFNQFEYEDIVENPENENEYKCDFFNYSKVIDKGMIKKLYKLLYFSPGKKQYNDKKIENFKLNL